MAMRTATKVAIEHYKRPEVREVIRCYCREGDAFRALNGDNGWYKKSSEPGKVQLTTPEDYDYLIQNCRTLYATLDLLDHLVEAISEKWDEQRGKPEKPIGTLANCIAFTLSVDIDSIKGPNGEDITASPEIKAAVEAAGRFFVDYLREHGIKKSVHCLYSGGGIYIHLHHSLFTANPEWTAEDREQAFRSLTMAFNSLIEDVSWRFFNVHPEHRGRVKFDALNNQKRKFKTIFSIHKRLPFAVIPLDPKHLEINFDKAKLPLSAEVLSKGTEWYKSYDLEELPKLQKLLKPFVERAEEELSQRKDRAGNYEISRRADPLPIESWPPCMKNIIEGVAPGKGPHRALAVLAAYLYQIGWDRDAAFELWASLAGQVGVETRIFDCWYGLMSCPNCSTLKKESTGYPRVGLGGLGYCEPDRDCARCVWPGAHEDAAGKKILEGLAEQIKEDPRKINRPENLKTLAELKRRDPIEYEIFIDGLRLSGAVKREAREAVKKMAAEAEANEGVEDGDPRIPDDIMAEAEGRLDEGKAFEYVLGVWQKRHYGDENLGKALFLSIGAQSCSSSKGIHIHACGPRGLGKSDGVEKASQAIPPKYLLIGSASPKALYYLGEQLPAGSVVYMDDIGWNDDAAQMLKICTTFYGEGATHTVVVDQKIQQFKTAERIIFWITTADAQTDEQVRDRLLRIDITEGQKHTQKVIGFIFEQRKGGAATFDSRELLVSRAIIYLLKQVLFDVVIPFAEHIRFDGDPRGATIFADLVSAFAIWRHRIRDQDINGAVIASYEDYKDAEIFFNAIEGHSDIKFTPRERKVLQAIKDEGGEATREKIMEKTSLSKGALSDIMNGRNKDGQAKYGLLHKCSALSEEDESIQDHNEDDTKTTRRRRVYRLPKDFDMLNAYGKAVCIATDETTIRRISSHSSSRFGDSSEEQNRFSGGLVREFVRNKVIRGNNLGGPSSDSIEDKTLTLSEAKRCELCELDPLDNDSAFRTFPEPRRTMRTNQHNAVENEGFRVSESKEIETSVRQEENDSSGDLGARDTLMPPRKDEATISKDPCNKLEPICAVCGENLVGRGQITRDGKVYCPRPGCGYPPREIVPVEDIPKYNAPAGSNVESSLSRDQIEGTS